MPSLHFADPATELTEKSPIFPGTSVVICLWGVMQRIRARELSARYPEIFPGFVRVKDRGHAGFFDFPEMDGLAVVETNASKGFIHRASVWIDKGSKRHGMPLPAKGAWEKLTGPVIDDDEVGMLVMTLEAVSALVRSPKASEALQTKANRVIQQAHARLRELDPSGNIERELNGPRLTCGV